MSVPTLEIKKKASIKVTIYGETYQVKKMTVGEAEQYSQVKDNTPEEKHFEKSIEMLSERGIPADVLRSMDLDDFVALSEFIVGTFKKK